MCLSMSSQLVSVQECFATKEAFMRSLSVLMSFKMFRENIVSHKRLLAYMTFILILQTMRFWMLSKGTAGLVVFVTCLTLVDPQARVAFLKMFLHLHFCMKYTVAHSASSLIGPAFSKIHV